MDLAAVAAAELYALLPSEFTAARNARAKQLRSAGQSLLAKQVERLPKPSAAAWALNMLARRRDEAIAQVFELGGELREAQENRDPARMRELGRQRSRLLGVVVGEGRAAAGELGVKVSDAAASEMEQTLRAAMTDPRAAEAVQSALLVRSFAGSGLEPVDLAGVVAVPGALTEAPTPRESEEAVPEARARIAGPARTGTVRGRARDVDAEGAAARDEARRREREETARHEQEEAAADLAEAQRSLSAAEAELADAEREAAEAGERRTRLAADLEELRRRVAALEEEAMSAEREAGHAARALRLASRLAEQERRAVRRAHERLEHLT